MLISVCVLALAVAAFVLRPEVFQSPGLFVGFVMMFAITAIAAGVPWDRIPRWAGLALPVLDVIAIVVIRDALPSFGVGILLLLPLLWVARTFPGAIVVGFTAFAAGALMGAQALSGRATADIDFATYILLPLVFVVVAASTFVGARRSRAQSVLLRQHSVLIEEALASARAQQAVLDTVLNTVPFGVVAFDRNRSVTFVNRAHRQTLADFGTAADAVIHPVVFQPDGVTPYGANDRPFARARAGQSFTDLVFWVGEPGARRAAYSASSRAEYGPDGAYEGGVLVIVDVTKEVEAVRARDDLVGSVSHELRSPLTSVLGYIDLARDDEELDPATRRMLDVAYSNSERLLVIVTDLLRAASDADQALAMSFVPCDIARIAAEAVEANQVTADEADVELRLSGVEEASVVADPVRMRQVLDNLVSNAIKYNREWGEVEVSVHLAGGEVEVIVRDTGQGMAEADLVRVFDRFYRTEAARGSETVGTGLGLSITRDIVQRHGGDLTVSSELGLGTEFRFTIPVSATPAEATDEHAEVGA